MVLFLVILSADFLPVMSSQKKKKVGGKPCASACTQQFSDLEDGDDDGNWHNGHPKCETAFGEFYCRPMSMRSWRGPELRDDQPVSTDPVTSPHFVHSM